MLIPVALYLAYLKKDMIENSSLGIAILASLKLLMKVSPI
jgi:hypothetical protein